jgi:hypothetical protein
MKRLYPAALLAGLALLLGSNAASGHYADPQANTADDTILYLGHIAVEGQRGIIITLQAIKVALKRPYSDKPQDADSIVCRINRQLGEAREYLDCATNRTYSKRRETTQVQILSTDSQHQADPYANSEENINPVQVRAVEAANATQALNDIMQYESDSRLHVPVNGPGLRKLLESLPMPSETTAAAPAAATIATPAATTAGSIPR